MAPYSITQLEPEDMSQDTSINEQLSDDDDVDDLFDDFCSPPVIPLPDVLPADNSLPQLLEQYCGTSEYEELTSVRLRVVASQTCLQRLHLYLPRLTELDLSGSHLLSLRTLGSGLDNLTVLRVGRCSLNTLDGLFGVTALRELYAPNNNVSDLGLLPSVPHLAVLDLTSNAVASLLQISFLALCDRLRELTLLGCPVSDLPGYKAWVLSSLPGLTHLDGSMLTQGGKDRCEEGRQQELSSEDSDGEEGGVTALPVDVPNSKGGVKTELVRRSRPATADGPRRSAALVLPQRPATATPLRRAVPTGPEGEGVSDAVSSLTSGGVVCGNLAVALRGKHRLREQKAAWSIQEKDETAIMTKSKMRNGLHTANLYSGKEKVFEGDMNGGGDHAHSKNSLLAASHQWRQSYHSFREAHSEQWQKEEEEEGC